MADVPLGAHRADVCLIPLRNQSWVLCEPFASLFL